MFEAFEDSREIVCRRILMVPPHRLSHPEHFFRELLAAVGEDEGLHDFIGAFDDEIDA